MRRIILLSVLSLSACTPEFDSLEEACHDNVPGEGTADCCTDAVRAVYRTNCYRRYAGMARGRLDGQAAQAAQAHAEYIDYNGFPADTPIWQEETGLQKFTGVTPQDRMAARGLVLDDSVPIGFWEGAWINDTDLSPEDIVDDWVDFYWARQMILQPGWESSGYGQFNEIVVMTVVYEFPAATNINTPVVYPVDGQTGVPTTFIIPADGYPVPGGTEVGYPITITVGSSDPTSSLDADNPYTLILLDEFVEGPDGAVEYFVEGPETTGADFPYTIGIVPTTPLQPNTRYRVGAEISWDAGAMVKKFTWSFTTGQDAAEGSGERVSRAKELYVHHQPPGWIRGGWGY